MEILYRLVVLAEIEIRGHDGEVVHQVMLELADLHLLLLDLLVVAGTLLQPLVLH